MLGVFHHRVVDGIGRTGGKRGLVQAAEIEVVLALCQRDFAGGENVGTHALQFVEELAAVEQEHAAVPEVIAGGEEFFGIFQIRFFDKTLDPMHVAAGRAQVERRAMLDIAVTGFRRIRHDAEGDQITGGHRIHALLDGGVKGCDVADQVICRQQQHHRIGIALEQC